MLIAVFQILYKLVAAVIAVRIVFNSRNPYKALAWTLVLLLLPLVGLIIYFFFGRTGRKERLIGERQLSVDRRALRRFVRLSSCKVNPNYEPMVRFLKMRCSSLPYANNEVRLFYSGTQMLEALLSDIKAAQHHIHVQFYIFADDSVGQMVRDALVERARNGVKVRVVYDDVGCFRVSSRFFDSMRREGIDAKCFLNVWFPRFAGRVNYRNHRKLVIIDGKIGYIGGMNLADRYVKGNKLGAWHDIHMRLHGGAVYSLQASFVDDWYFVSGSNISADSLFPDIHVEPQVHNTIQTVRSNPVGQRADIMHGLLMLIISARHYIYIQTPYFLPTQPLLVALRMAAMSGVDVRIMLPRHSDSILPYWGSRSFVEDMLSAGVRIYFFDDGFLHSKMWVSDDSVASLGSANVDFRSFENNFEVNSFLYDSSVATELKAHFRRQMGHCTRITYTDWLRRPMRHRIVESFVRLLAPLL